ncbi:hypothetical protein QF034_002728 [Streptomyces africanus]|uniref:Transposase n=1 Tax=Streptomyces africanus TaxID=231024 RepID=A0ABU0QQ18_9ACTN|nr:hypothetical protein [Streptomyces africanus]
MKLVVQVRLLPTPVQAAALEATLRACNEAATWVSQVAFERGEFKNFALRKLTYEQVKSRWNLGAQAAQHTIKKTCDAYATLKANLRAAVWVVLAQHATAAPRKSPLPSVPLVLSPTTTGCSRGRSPGGRCRSGPSAGG